MNDVYPESMYELLVMINQKLIEETSTLRAELADLQKQYDYAYAEYEKLIEIEDALVEAYPHNEDASTIDLIRQMIASLCL